MSSLPPVLSRLLFYAAFGGIFFLVPILLVIEGVRSSLHRRSYQRWLETEGSELEEHPLFPGSFTLSEKNRPLRARFLRRVGTGWASLHSRGHLEWQKPDEWSPVESRPGKRQDG